MMRVYLSLLAVICAVLLPDPSFAESDDQPSGTIAVEDSAAQDAAIAVRIRDILQELGGYEDVTVTVASGIVTLRGTTLDHAAAARLNELTSRVEGVIAIENEVTETTDVVERLNPAIERFMERSKQVLAYTPLLLVALLGFAVVVVIGFVIARLREPWNRLAPNAFIADIYRQIIRLASMIGGLVVALDILGATALLSTILGAAGIIGLAIGFAVRDTVENFIASIMLSIRQPFRPNDSVEIGGDEGKVVRLTSRATILLNWDGNHVRIPNATVFKSRILNYSRNAERRFQFKLSVAPDTDLDNARGVALKVLKGLPFVLDTPVPSVWVSDVGDSTINMTFTGWIDQRNTSILMARSEAIRLSLAAFNAAHIAMPEPTYRLLTDGLPGTPTTSDPVPNKTPAAAAPVLTGSEIDASAEEALEHIVNEERAALKEDDLLNRKGATEE